jgi:mannan endo-1,4-beta-mannosidase
MKSRVWSITTAIFSVVFALMPQSIMAQSEGMDQREDMSQSAEMTQTANPNASPDAKKLLAYISSLPSQPHHRVISGQLLGMLDGYDAQPPYRDITYGYKNYVEDLAKQSGKWVGMVGVNYGRMRSCSENNPLVPTQKSPFMNCDGSPPDYSVASQILIDYWNAGGLVTVMWHAPNPWTGQSAHDMNMNGNFSDLYTPGNPMYTTWHKMLDDLALGLTPLKEAGVVVLFRPLHEQNGNFFWWGNRGPNTSPTPAEFAELWRDMFKYLSYKKKLNNLLWVFCPNHNGAADTTNNVLCFNPGRHYVDIVGVDVYENDSRVDRKIPYDQLMRPGKPIGLAEYGPVDKYLKKPQNSDGFNWLRLHDIMQRYPKLTFFMAWDGTPDAEQSLIQAKNGAKLLHDPLVANRDDLKWR